jgi:chorismate mutase
MRGNLGKWALLVAVVLSGTGIGHAQDAIEQLKPLVETSAHRLAIAEQVALSKWDSRAAVEDAPREAQVIMGAVKDGEAKGLDRVMVTNFFKAQIEANKVVQYSLLADWERAGKAPAHEPINLAGTIRPELDQVQTALAAELAATVDVRASSTCHADLAKAVGRYLSGHAGGGSALRGIALDRSLAAACTK